MAISMYPINCCIDIVEIRYGRKKSEASLDLNPYRPTKKPVLHKVINDIKFCNAYYTMEHTFSSLVLYISSR
jgi:hypothetical protein